MNSVKSYQGSEIRNVAVTGHSHSGKTTLVAALLHAGKMTPKPGRVDDGSAVTAYDEEEVSRRMTMQNAVAFAEWSGVKINFVDTPGFHMFVHEARSAMLPVEAALVVINTPNGPETVTGNVWKYAEEFNLAARSGAEPDGSSPRRSRCRADDGGSTRTLWAQRDSGAAADGERQGL